MSLRTIAIYGTVLAAIIFAVTIMWTLTVALLMVTDVIPFGPPPKIFWAGLLTCLLVAFPSIAAFLWSEFRQ